MKMGYRGGWQTGFFGEGMPQGGMGDCSRPRFARGQLADFSAGVLCLDVFVRHPRGG